MVSYSRSIFSDQVSMEGVADHWVRKTSYMLQKGLSFRNLPGKSELFTDIAYQDLVSQPLDQIERIYQLFGGMPESLKQCFQRAEADNPYGKYGIHEYSLEDFNLGPMELTRRNSAYLQLMDRVIQPGVNGTTSHASDL
jgi:hypothetical protein